MAIFTAPFFCYSLAVLVVDPYNFFNLSHLVPDSVKQPVSNLNYPLWKMSDYRHRPLPNVLLGDSRMDGIETGEIRKFTGENYYNFAYGGATLKEMIRTFWFADSLTNLQVVYMGMNFNLYNALERNDRTEDYRNIVKNPLLYFVHPTVRKAVWYNLRAVLGAKVAIGVPHMNRDSFWKHQLDVTARRMYRRYEYPEEYREELSRIARHCRSKGIRLVFVIFPTHTDLQARVSDFGLERQREQFRRDLQDLGTTFDFDFPNEITSNRENFKDPFHLKANITELLTQDLWADTHLLPCRRSVGRQSLPSAAPASKPGTMPGETAAHLSAR